MQGGSKSKNFVVRCVIMVLVPLEAENVLVVPGATIPSGTGLNSHQTPSSRRRLLRNRVVVNEAEFLEAEIKS